MSGNPEGGRKAAATNKERHGWDFFQRIGRKGGKNSHNGGFAYNKALASVAGAKGGRNGKRGPAMKNRATIRITFPDGTFDSDFKVSMGYAIGIECNLLNIARNNPRIVKRVQQKEVK